MPVESVTYISDLNPANPAGGDPKAAGDDHLRNIKQALKATFPNINGPVNATPAQLNLLVGKTDVATAADIAAASLAATLPNQAGNAGKFITTDGTNATWASIDLRGSPVVGNVNTGTATQTIHYANGEGQTLTATGAFTLAAGTFPAGKLSAVLLRLINGGAYPMTSTGITWKKPDGTETTSFASSGITLQAAGSNLVLLVSYGDGTVYGVVR